LQLDNFGFAFQEMQPAMMTTTRHKTKRQFLGFSRRNLASFMSMVLFVLYLISAATTIRSYWELSSSTSIISDIAPHFLGSASSDSRRNLSTKSTEASSATNNASASTNSPHKHSAVGRLTLPNTWQHLAVLEKVTNLTYVDSLVHALENRSRVYFPGPWDGAGIVVEEFKLVLFTQGKVRAHPNVKQPMQLLVVRILTLAFLRSAGGVHRL
jgi:hypothetical protein